MNKATAKKEKRTRRHSRIRAKIKGTAERPRLAVFRSNKFIYAQLINDETGVTIAATDSRKDTKGGAREQAQAVGTRIAEAAGKAKITHAVFDRGGFLYEGAIQEVADSARKAGLTF